MRTSVRTDILPLFSSPVYVAEDPSMPNIIRDIEGWEYHKAPREGSQTFEMNVLDRIPKFRDWLQYHVEEYVWKVMGIDERCHEITYTCSWINRHKFQEKTHDHSHRNSMFSGICYLQTHERCGDLVFRDESYCMVAPRIKTGNLYNSKQWTIQPKDGMVVMFPSSLVHLVTPNQIMRERYSLAFNIFLKGDFGNPTSLLKL